MLYSVVFFDCLSFVFPEFPNLNLHHSMPCSLCGSAGHNRRTCRAGHDRFAAPPACVNNIVVVSSQNMQQSPSYLGSRRAVWLGVDSLTTGHILRLPSDACARSVYERARVACLRHATQRKMQCAADPLIRHRYGIRRGVHEIIKARKRYLTVFTLYNNPSIAHVQQATAQANASFGWCAPALLHDAVERVAEYCDRENATAFDAEIRTVIDIVNAIAKEERAAWHADEMLSAVLRQRCSLGLVDSRSWLFDHTPCALDVPTARTHYGV